MPRLVLLSGERSVDLAEKAAIRIGRRDENDFAISDPSISGAHCEVIWDGSSCHVRDMNSTNGTFVDNQPVQECQLEIGQVLRLGNVELKLENDGVGGVSDSAAHETETEVAGACASHRSTAGEWFCARCRKLWCPQCVNLRNVGSSRLAFCRACGGQCIDPFGAAGPTRSGSFWKSIPRAFLYPLHKGGLFMILLGAILFPVLDFVGSFSVYLGIVALGYWFAWMQKILHASGQGDEKLADWPDVTEFSQDILVPAFQWIGVCILSFGPGLAVLALGKQAALGWTLLGLGGVFFPMILLTVAMADSLAGLNPLFWVPAILKIPGPYFAALVVLGIVGGINFAAQLFIDMIELPFLPSFLDGLLSLYGSVVMMRLLGLLYYYYKPRLGWFR